MKAFASSSFLILVMAAYGADPISNEKLATDAAAHDYASTNIIGRWERYGDELPMIFSTNGICQVEFPSGNGKLALICGKYTVTSKGIVLVIARIESRGIRFKQGFCFDGDRLTNGRINNETGKQHWHKVTDLNPDPLEGWRLCPHSVGFVFETDYQDYIQKLQQVDRFNIRRIDIFRDAAGKHAVKLEIAYNGLLHERILIYDKNNNRIKVLNVLGGKYGVAYAP